MTAPAPLSRRCFLKWSTLLGSSFFTAFPPGRGADSIIPIQDVAAGERVIRVGCPSHNCGGRCLLKVHVLDGIIARIESDDRPADTLEDPQLRACIRGRAYRHRQYHRDRLKYPMKRTGKRGGGKFERITWNEALDKVAAELTRVKRSGSLTIGARSGSRPA